MEELEKKLGYTFRDPELLRAALYHSSYANEHHLGSISSNERLEFLGDSVLGMIVADHLYRTFPDLPEGDLTRIRANLVCEGSLVRRAAGRWCRRKCGRAAPSGGTAPPLWRRTEQRRHAPADGSCGRVGCPALWQKPWLH